MRKPLTLLFALFFTSLSIVEAQTMLDYSTSSDIGFRDITRRKPTLFERTDIDGSPYLHNQFKKGIVVLKNGNTVDKIPLRFNLYTNELEFYHGKDTFALDNFLIAGYFETEGDSSTLKRFSNSYPPVDKNTTASIYQVLAGGMNISFLKFYRQNIDEAKVQGAYAVRKNLVTLSDYYIYSLKDGIRQVRLSAKSISASLQDYQTEIEKITAANNLNLKKEKDVIKLINLLDAAK